MWRSLVLLISTLETNIKKLQSGNKKFKKCSTKKKDNLNNQWNLSKVNRCLNMSKIITYILKSSKINNVREEKDYKNSGYKSWVKFTVLRDYAHQNISISLKKYRKTSICLKPDPCPGIARSIFLTESIIKNSKDESKFCSKS